MVETTMDLNEWLRKRLEEPSLSTSCETVLSLSGGGGPGSKRNSGGANEVSEGNEILAAVK